MKNLVKDIEKDVLKRIGEQVVRTYGIDYDSLDEYRKHVETQSALVSSLVEKKDFPWEGASNVKLPILTNAVLQFHSRARRALLPPNGPVKVAKTGEEDFQRSVRVQKYMNYQLYEDIPSWKRDMDLALMRVGVTGTVFKKTYYDEMTKRVESKLCEWDSVVVPYGTHCIEDAPRISYPYTLTARKVMLRVKDGQYVVGDMDKDLSPADTTDKTAEDKTTKQIDNRDKDIDKEYNFIEQQGFYEFGLDGEDGIPQPYIVKVCKDTGYVVSVVSNADKNNKSEHVQHYTVYNLIPNIRSGVYSWGWGILLEGMTRSANSLLNQYIDGGTLANTRGGFIKRRSGLKRGDLAFKLGEYKEVDILGDRIGDAIYNHDFKGPDQSLFQVLGLIFEQSDKVATISDIATGQMPPRNTPAATIMALIEQGQMVYSTIHERLHDSFKSELAKIYALNNEHLNVQKYMDILGDDFVLDIAEDEIEGNPSLQQGLLVAGESEDIKRPIEYSRKIAASIISKDFEGRSDVYPVSDPNITSNAEKMIKAQEVLDRTLADPIRSQDRMLVWKAYDIYYKALNVEDRDEINPMPEPDEPQDIPAIEEEAGWFTEQPSEPVEGQDHLSHLESHLTFLNSESAQNLSPQGRKLADAHIQQTYAAIHREGLDANIGAGEGGLAGAQMYPGIGGTA